MITLQVIWNVKIVKLNKITMLMMVAISSQLVLNGFHNHLIVKKDIISILLIQLLIY